MNKLVLLLCFTLIGCGSEMRQPFCHTSITQLPPEFLGSYEITFPFPSAVWSGGAIMKSVLVEVTSHEILLSQSTNAPKWGQVCEVGGQYYLENRNPDGTYSISQVAKTSDGLAISAIAIDLDIAQERGYSIQYLPDSKSILKGGEPSVSAVTSPLSAVSTVFILDNTQLSQAQVLAITKTISAPLLLRAAKPVKENEPKMRIALTKGGLTGR